LYWREKAGEGPYDGAWIDGRYDGVGTDADVGIMCSYVDKSYPKAKHSRCDSTGGYSCLVNEFSACRNNYYMFGTVESTIQLYIPSGRRLEEGSDSFVTMEMSTTVDVAEEVSVSRLFDDDSTYNYANATNDDTDVGGFEALGNFANDLAALDAGDIMEAIQSVVDENPSSSLASVEISASGIEAVGVVDEAGNTLAPSVSPTSPAPSFSRPPTISYGGTPLPTPVSPVPSPAPVATPPPTSAPVVEGTLGISGMTLEDAQANTLVFELAVAELLGVNADDVEVAVAQVDGEIVAAYTISAPSAAAAEALATDAATYMTKTAVADELVAQAAALDDDAIAAAFADVSVDSVSAPVVQAQDDSDVVDAASAAGDATAALAVAATVLVATFPRARQN